MNKKLLITIIGIFTFCFTAKAQIIPIVAANGASVSTQNVGRFEFIQSSIARSQSFLLDKYTGRVWRYRTGQKKFEEISRENFSPPTEETIHFQLYIGGENSKDCFLLNIHTGEMWRYTSDSGDKIFTKMDVPVDLLKEE